MTFPSHHLHHLHFSNVYLPNVTMLVFEAKLNGTQQQYAALDEAIRTARFVRNSCIKYWMENKGVGRYDLSKYCAVLAADDEFPWARKLNSMA